MVKEGILRGIKFVLRKYIILLFFKLYSNHYTMMKHLTSRVLEPNLPK